MRGRSANLWYAAAKALGFDVSSIRCPDPLFVGHIKGLGVQAKSLASLPRRLRRPHRLPDVVFSDVASIPLGPDSVEYWGSWTTPHLFYCLGSDDSVAWGGSTHHPSGTTAIAPPPGWAARSVRLAHHETGAPRRDGIRLTPSLLSRLHGPRAGELHCCAASMIGSGRPLTMGSAAPASPGSRWSARGGWC